MISELQESGKKLGCKQLCRTENNLVSARAHLSVVYTRCGVGFWILRNACAAYEL